MLCIDGVDLLAKRLKRDKKLCNALISLAKLMANTNKLKVVLITSEGAIMPFLEEFSAANRSLVYEIGDLDEEQAMRYLLGKNMRQDTAKKVVSCVGGRLVYTYRAVLSCPT